MKKIIVSILVLCVTCSNAAQIKHTKIYSKAMDKNIPLSLVIPQKYFTDKDARFPVLYTLNGLNSDNLAMFNFMTDIMTEYVDKYNVIMAIPYNGMDSWYFDNPGKMYETFTAKELVEYMDTTYRTKAERNYRIICGGSMGGHGALFISAHYPETYYIVGSLAAVADLTQYGTDWSTGKRTLEDSNSLTSIDKFKKAEFALYVDIGVNDFLYDANKAFHQALLKEGVKHVYVEREGAHDNPYWVEAWKSFFNFMATELKKLEK